MTADDRTLRTAEEFEAITRRFDIQHFGDLFEAFEMAVSRVFGTSIQQLARQSEFRLIREIHASVVKPTGQIDTTQTIGVTTK